jgi:hypothetical protein
MNSSYKSIFAIGPTQEELNEHRWPLEVGALWLHGLLLRLCAFWWFIDRRESEDKYGTWDNARAAWVVCWLIVLIVLWAINPSGILSEIFSVLAVLRLVEIVTSGLGTILDRRQQARVRSLVTIAIYAIQVALIFAILEHSWASNAFINGHTHASHAFDFLYISWTDMTTLGNNIYTPANDIARVLQMLTAASGLFLFGVLLAFGINRLPKSQNKNTPKY